jgi:DNA primase
MAYDGDKAGRAAALKASKLLSAGGFDGGVVVFGGGLDPADMVKEGRVEELADMFRSAKPFIEFVLDEILSLFDLSNPKEKEACMQEGVAYLKSLSPLLQEEYRTYLASRLGGLGVSPSLVKLTTNTNQNATLMQKNSHRDMWELSLIKTVLEKPSLANQILDVLDPSILQFHSREFSLALAGKTELPELMAISVDESIVVLNDENALNAELITFLTKYYERELKKVNLSQNITFEEKAFYIRKFRGKIAKLKQGELVAYEG